MHLEAGCRFGRDDLPALRSNFLRYSKSLEETVPSLLRHFWPCLRVIIERVNNQRKITYGELAGALGLSLAQQEWHTVLNPIANRTKDDLGQDYDLTWNVVYGTGPAAGLGRYSSNEGRPTASELLDPKDHEQVAKYKATLAEIFRFTYSLQMIEGRSTVVKTPQRPARTASYQ
jgi:hypothetical protein